MSFAEEWVELGASQGGRRALVDKLRAAFRSVRKAVLRQNDAALVHALAKAQLALLSIASARGVGDAYSAAVDDKIGNWETASMSVT